MQSQNKMIRLLTIVLCTSLWAVASYGGIPMQHDASDAAVQLSQSNSILDIILPSTEKNDQPSIQSIQQTDWWHKVQKNIRDQEYHITPQKNTNLPSSEILYQAPNRTQNLRTYFSSQGIRIVKRTDNNPAWQALLRLDNCTRGKTAIPFEAETDPVVIGNRIEFDRGSIVEWYENMPEGIEQGFTITERAKGAAVLELVLSVGGNVTPQLVDDGKTVIFKTDKKETVLIYSHLHVLDSHGKILPSWFLLEQSRLKIVVDDRNAAYPVIIDPLLTTPYWTVGGDQAGASLGYSVSTAGDVNGDGFSDVIIGARNYDNAGANMSEGRVFVYYGSSSGPSLTADWMAQGEQYREYFGGFVSIAGDVNGDGFSDIIVGAAGYDDAGSNHYGRALVFHGSEYGLPDADSDGIAQPDDANWSAMGDQEGADFGRVSTAGDVNGDGYSDVMIAASSYDGPNPGTEEGRVFVYYGAASGLSTAADWMADGSEAVVFGRSISAAGDVNGDGFGDVIIAGFSRVYLFHGAASGLPDANEGGIAQTSDASWKAECDDGDAGFGYVVSTAGDVNGDGFSDIVIGAPWYHDISEDTIGRAFVFLGSAAGLPDADSDGLAQEVDAAWVAAGDQDASQFGYAVSLAGDVNGDGFSDVMIGAYQYDTPDPARGMVFVYQGSATGLPDADDDGVAEISDAYWSVAGDQYLADFGRSLSAAGDVNGDGFSDIIVGADSYDISATGEGRVFVYYGAPDGLSETSVWSDESPQADAAFAYSVASAGDVNGDGFDDVIVGAPDFDTAEDYAGRVFVYLGSDTGLSDTPDDYIDGDKAGAGIGRSVASAGDVNGDGFGDILIGAPFYDASSNNDGRAFVYHGSPTGLSDNSDWSYQGDKAEGYFGWCVSTAGDINGDGFSDVLISAYRYDNHDANDFEGRIFVFHGSESGLSTTADWMAEHDQDYSNFGYSLSGAGDVNGDGYSDVIVGAYMSLIPDTGGNRGEVYVFHGSASGLPDADENGIAQLSDADWTAENDQNGGMFGSAVSTAGDVNGDGFSDVIIGAPGYDISADNSHEGRAFVYFGSVSGLSDEDQDGVAHTSDADWIADGDQARLPSSNDGGSMGCAVSVAGDVNGDGYSDIIIAAEWYRAPSNNEGRAYVFHGSAEGLPDVDDDGFAQTSDAAWTASGSLSDAHFGKSVSTAGDVNGDGFADIIVGAESNEGTAYVFFGAAAGGRPVTMGQLKADAATPISQLGMSDEESSIIITGLGCNPIQRDKVKLEWEVKPAGVSFDGTDTTTSSIWQDTGTSGYEFNEMVSDLTGHADYHWRARFRYPAGNPGGQTAGRWYVPFPENIGRLDFRTNNNPPIGGYDDAHVNVIAGSQISQSTEESESGLITIHFRIKDGGRNDCILHTFEYSVDGGTTWKTPLNGDSSGCLGGGWPDNDGSWYSSAVDWTGIVHAFTFNTRHADVIADFESQFQDDVQIRFTVNDGLEDSVLPVESELFAVDHEPPATGTITIVDDGGSTSDSTPELTISSAGADYMRFALLEGELGSASWVNYSTSYSSFNISPGDNGEKTVWVEYRDEFWNIQTTHASDITIYDSSPVVTSDSAVSYDTTPTWTWDSNGGTGTYRIKLNDQPWSTDITETSYTPSVLDQRFNTLYVQEWNASGYWSWSGEFTIEIDSGDPCSEASSPAAVDDLGKTFIVTYTHDDIYNGETCGSAGSGSGVASVALYVKAPGEETYTVVATDTEGEGDGLDGQFSYSAADEGAYDFYTIATDRAGNVEPASGADTRTIYASQFSGYAIVAVGAVPDEEGIQAHTLTANNVYKHLINRNFALVDNPLDRWSDPLDHIKYFNPYDDDQIGEDDYTEGGSLTYLEAMQKAITEWALDKMTNLPGPLFITLIDHGTENYFYLEGYTAMTAQNLDDWLTTLETGLSAADVEEDIVIILGSCYSASFMDELSRPGRIIVAASAADEPSYRGPEDPVFGVRDGEFFTTSLFNELGKGKSLKDSFLNATERVEIHTDSGYGNNGDPYFDAAMQHPFLDDDGTLPGSHELQPGGDGERSKDIYLGYATGTGEPIEIIDVIGYPDTVFSTSTLLLWANVSNTATVDRVWVEIREPDTTLEGGTGQQLVDLIEVPLSENGNRYEVTPIPIIFSEAGRYTLFFYARDDDGFISHFKKSYIYKEIDGNTPPDAFELVSPANGATTSISLVLDWEDARDTTDGHDVSYIVTVSTDANMSNPDAWVVRREGVENSTIAVSAADGIENLSTYYWQVTAVDAYGAGTTSPVWSFDTDSTTNPLAGWIKGYVYDTATGGFITSATLSIGANQLNSSLNGYYLGILTAGGYSATVTAPGYEIAGSIALTIPEGGILTRNFGLTPAADSQPVAAIVSPASNVIIEEGASVNFQGSVSGGDAPITCWWNFDGGAANSALEDPGALTFLSAGVYTVTFTATDADGDVDGDSVIITVTEPDLCPGDPEKTEPGICGCGVPDIDTDGDGAMDCIDDDDDDDGMPDDWEESYGLDPLVNDADDDPDNDGYSNLDEYALGSNPKNRNDPEPKAMPWLPILLE